MDEPRTCGEGLAQRADLPARMSALTAAMAEVLEGHQRTLDLETATPGRNWRRTSSWRKTSAGSPPTSVPRRSHDWIS
jgi:hypothetical protein